jgi:parallel beta-helix repeat protein
LDGIQLVADDIVFVDVQTDKIENGLYLAHESSWTGLSGYTPADGQAFDRQYIPVLQGTDAGKRYVVATEQYTIGTTEIEFIESAFSPEALPGKIVIRDRDGKIAGGGKRTADIIVGSTTEGHTLADVDYLCDGVDDQVEINAAIQALPSDGGKIVILGGEYNATDRIVVDRGNVTIEGMGASTVIKRMYNEVSAGGVIHVVGNNARISSLLVDGGDAAHDGISNGIYIGGDYCIVSDCISKFNPRAGITIAGNKNKILANTCSDSFCGIEIPSGTGNVISGNHCELCQWSGMSDGAGASASNISGNTVLDNPGGIMVYGTRGTIIGNTVMRGAGLPGDYTGDTSTIAVQSGGAYNLIADNNIPGRNYSNVAGATNTFVNNKYN